MDSRDFIEARERCGRSRYHTMVAQNLRVLKEEGLVLTLSYSDLLPPSSRLDIHEIGESMASSLSLSRRINFLRKAYEVYMDINELKVQFLTDNPAVLAAHTKLLHALKRQLLLLSDKANAKGAVESNLNAIVLKQYLWKTAAALYISGSISSKVRGIAYIHDTPEYADAAKAILDYIILPEMSFDGFERRANFYRRTIKQLLEAAVPFVRTSTEGELRFFLKDRASFEDLRKLLRYLDELYDSFAGEDLDFAERAARKEMETVIKFIKNEIAKIKHQRELAWLPLELLRSELGNLRKLFGGNRQDYEEAKGRVAEKLGHFHEWAFALLRLFDPEASIKAEKAIIQSKLDVSHLDVKPEWWITGNISEPWYVKPPEE